MQTQEAAVDDEPGAATRRRIKAGDEHVGAGAILAEAAAILEQGDRSAVLRFDGAADAVAAGIARRDHLFRRAGIPVGLQPLLHHEGRRSPEGGKTSRTVADRRPPALAVDVDVVAVRGGGERDAEGGGDET